MIEKLKLLSIGDIKNMQREPLLLFALFGILLLATVIRYGLPELDDIFNHFTAFSLQPHFQIITGISLLMAPLMVGMLYGLIILDERDEGLLVYFSVTPITKTGYLLARITAPVIVTFFMSYLFILVQGIAIWDWATFLPISILLSLQAPIVTILLASLASNKVEGLALIKVINLMLFAPLIDYIFSHPTAKFVMIFPLYWPVQAFMQIGKEPFWLYVITGLFVTVFWLWLFGQMFRRRNE
ncbi:fluoroquinolone transport system permease protein [Gracilibacillus ureilyticus]|uniref:Fluoroquinolone transport system permease protein n=1 Tax=Gracilibacillus ureilyticus TaxID=531814 RepID=A0A1H9U9R1_9BACI|nr:hypothetical protein [Gracilibacillus ureilyticus]SES05884.1 fluoroquinolone transport system permease protein [Gracilibacillus ureilyticus]